MSDDITKKISEYGYNVRQRIRTKTLAYTEKTRVATTQFVNAITSQYGKIGNLMFFNAENVVSQTFSKSALQFQQNHHYLYNFSILHETATTAAISTTIAIPSFLGIYNHICLSLL